MHKVMSQRLDTYLASWSRLMILRAESTSSLTIPSPSSMLISVPIRPRLGPLMPFTCAVCVREKRGKGREREIDSEAAVYN